MPEKTKNKIFISAKDATVAVSSDRGSLIKNIKEDEFLYKYIPSPRISLKKPGRVDAYLDIKNNNVFAVKFNYPHVYCYQPSKKADTRGLISLLGYILDRANSDKGIYPMHASIVCKGGKAVVLFGGTTNLGKSAVAKTIADKHGWMFFSDESALLDEKNKSIVGGVKVVSDNDEFAGFNLDETGDNPKILAFVHPHIDNGLSRVVKWDTNKFLWHLKEELARKIRGGSKAIDHFSYPLESLDTFEISKKRLNFAKEISKKLPCYEMRGTPEVIAGEINKLI